ncbi:DUF2147 domain-containing protein [Pedobacter frigiditerrae]|uniref:DUF2147 domain-containing protein n=1 Tax=Pedobacter frigiditerrae TaxID=2530452 RepID=A0A4R0MXE4_9SPHI|nr:DUF2147 domain-containing protein [Pedobacter frigiditerrae]TCC91959.1 DUF2147 domain-containing protein [Pedobacter frigiditerrae]
MFKKLAVLFILFASTLSVFAQKKDDILGKWLNSSGEGQIEIFKKGEKYFGKLVWIKDPNDENGKPRTDVKNPNTSLRTKPILGLEIVKDFVYEDNEWTEGKVYDPKTGKSYSGNMSLEGVNKLKMRGYIGISLIGRTEVWKKVK